MLSPVFFGLKKEGGKADDLHCKMSIKEKIALDEARKIVRVYGSKINQPFKYGEGNLEN